MLLPSGEPGRTRARKTSFPQQEPQANAKNACVCAMPLPLATMLIGPPPADQNPGVSVACGRRMGVNPCGELGRMVNFLLWCILLFFCWPLALLALVLYPLVWILMLPFRLVGIAVDGVFELLRALITLPARILRGPRHA